MKQHNYLKKIRQYAAKHKIPAGSIQDLVVEHDDWCGIYRNRRCNCDPNVRRKRPGDERRAIIRRDPPAFVNLEGGDRNVALVLCAGVGSGVVVPSDARTGVCYRCRSPVWLSAETVEATRGLQRQPLCDQCSGFKRP